MSWPSGVQNKIYCCSYRPIFVFRLSSVKVTLVYLGQAREVAGTKEEDLVLTTPARVDHAVTQAVSSHPGLDKLKETIKLLLNGQWTVGDAELKNGDRLTFLPPVGGG